MKPLVSLTMIVRNEAASIRGVLEAVKPVVDRFTIVDTGSTDGTPEIARQVMGDLPGEVLELPLISVAHTRGWEGFEDFCDFAANRNRCRGIDAGAAEPAEFQLILSGDEYPREGAKLREQLEENRDSKIDCFFIGVFVADSVDNAMNLQPRILRTNSLWNYKGELHEYPAHPDLQALTTAVHAARIDHIVSDSEARFRNIEERHIPLLQRMLEEDPNDVRALIFLAQSYEALLPFCEDPEEKQAFACEAVDLYRRRLELSSGTEAERLHVEMHQLDTASVSGQFTDKQLYAWAVMLCDQNPRRPELALVRADFGKKFIPLGRLYELYRKAATLADEVRSSPIDNDSLVSTSVAWKAHYFAAVIARQLAVTHPTKDLGNGVTYGRLARDHVAAGLASGGTWEVFKVVAKPAARPVPTPEAPPSP